MVAENWIKKYYWIAQTNSWIYLVARHEIWKNIYFADGRRAQIAIPGYNQHQVTADPEYNSERGVPAQGMAQQTAVLPPPPQGKYPRAVPPTHLPTRTVIPGYDSQQVPVFIIYFLLLFSAWEYHVGGHCY